MKTVNLSESDLSDMKLFYELELDRAQQRVNHIQNILSKIGGSPVVAVRQTGAPTERIIQTRKRRKKRGRKAIWGDFIVKLLKRVDMPLTYGDVFAAAMLEFKVPPARQKNTRQTLINTAFRLRTINHKILTHSVKGMKEKYIGLTSWFDNDGKLLPEFEQKVPRLEKVVKPAKASKKAVAKKSLKAKKATKKTAAKSKTGTRKVGRPRKSTTVQAAAVKSPRKKRTAVKAKATSKSADTGVALTKKNKRKAKARNSGAPGVITSAISKNIARKKKETVIAVAGANATRRAKFTKAKRVVKKSKSQ